MRKDVTIRRERPAFMTVSGATYAQVDAWFGHTLRDLKLDVIYPEDPDKRYPCIVWICGGAWLDMDRSAHTAFLAWLAMRGFVVASVEYRTSNEAQFPAPLLDVKAAIRYLRAHADRFHIDTERFGTMGESAGGYLTAMSALADDPAFDRGMWLDFSSRVQAAVPWYPPTDFATMESALTNAAAPESLLLGKNVADHREEAAAICPVHYVTKDAPPMMIIHGTADTTVPFTQGLELHDRLAELGCDVTLIAIDGAEHADLAFFQQEIWDMIAAFFKEKLGEPEKV